MEQKRDGYTSVIGVLGTVTKRLVQEIEDLEIRRRALLRPARILGRVPEILEDLLSLKIQAKTINWRWC